MLTLTSPLKDLFGVGETVAEKLSKLNLVVVENLLHYYPRRYEDFSHPRQINQLKANEHHIIKARVLSVHNELSPKRQMKLTRALVADESGQIGLLWFNQPFLIRLLREGTTWLFAGPIEADYEGNLTMVSPTIEREERILSIYGETIGLTTKTIRKLLFQLQPMLADMADWLPEPIRQQHRLVTLGAALSMIHFPETLEQISLAKWRLAFDELFLLLLAIQITKQQVEHIRGLACQVDIKVVKQFIEQLPFTLTDSQRLASWQIIKDLGRPVPMHRLLEGDVGSGKTVVGAIAALVVAKNGYQTVWMAPTEILAQQHAATGQQLLEPQGLKIALLTSSTTRQISADLSRFDLVIGTQAVIQEHVQFERLGLVIVDEQHRFGVQQRNRLLKPGRKQPAPHLLAMTATPIPRTLALTIYGDLDISQLQELPTGRKPVITRFVDPKERDTAYQFIRQQVNVGRQVFVVCPLIEQATDRSSGQLSLDFADKKAATTEYAKLKQKIFPDLRIGLLHGKQKPSEKTAVMAAFKSDKLDILVSTAVIEVGIDIANATVMMIEGADRFGLAQLHQFRGRVGRGQHQSYCFVFTDSTNPATYERLRAFATTSSGFELAELDLRLRGPGQLAGLQQSGFSGLKLASLSDIAVIRQAKAAAEATIGDGLSNYPLLAQKVVDEQRRAHLG